MYLENLPDRMLVLLKQYDAIKGVLWRITVGAETQKQLTAGKEIEGPLQRQIL